MTRMSNISPGRRTMEAEPQTSASTIPPSLIRTLIPLLAGLAGTWLVDKFGLPVNGEVAGALVTAGIAYAYYATARFLEVYASDKWGYILGFRKLPVYATPPLPAAVVVEEGAHRDEYGAARPAGIAWVLIAFGLICIVIGAILASQLLLVLGFVGVVLGVVLWLTGTRA